jgi:hypothetical protein
MLILIAIIVVYIYLYVELYESYDTLYYSFPVKYYDKIDEKVVKISKTILNEYKNLCRKGKIISLQDFFEEKGINKLNYLYSFDLEGYCICRENSCTPVILKCEFENLFTGKKYNIL